MVSDCYDPSAYGGLPSIALAVKEFNAMDGEALVSGIYRELFLEHSARDTKLLMREHTRSQGQLRELNGRENLELSESGGGQKDEG